MAPGGPLVIMGREEQSDCFRIKNLGEGALAASPIGERKYKWPQENTEYFIFRHSQGGRRNNEIVKILQGVVSFFRQKFHALFDHGFL